MQRRAVPLAAFHKQIAVVVEYGGGGVFTVDVVRFGTDSAPIECVGNGEAMRAVRDELEIAYTPGDSIEFSGIFFDDVEGAIRAVAIALDVT
jgi:hypothetical protein